MDGEHCDLDGDMNTWDSQNAKDAANSMMTHLERETIDTEQEEGRYSYLNFLNWQKTQSHRMKLSQKSNQLCLIHRLQQAQKVFPMGRMMILKNLQMSLLEMKDKARLLA